MIIPLDLGIILQSTTLRHAETGKQSNSMQYNTLWAWIAVSSLPMASMAQAQVALTLDKAKRPKSQWKRHKPVANKPRNVLV